MARDLVPLKVVIGLDPVTGHALYPEFNLIEADIRQNMDWSKYLDVHGGGMHYDKTCGHKEDSIDSPYGVQHCCFCVPASFATEALRLFPDVVSELTDVEFELFHDVKAHAHEPDETVDGEVLNSLSARKQLMEGRLQDTTALDADIDAALDPNNKEVAGVRKNVNKKWVDKKAVQGVNLVALPKV